MAQPQRSGSDRLLTPANVITLVRICLVPVFVAALLAPWPAWFGLDGFTEATKSLIAAGVFIIISCTDWIDGYLARSRNEVTDFGKFMDPLADKILVAAALLALVELDVLPSWPVLIILAREFIVSGIRMIAASKGEVIAASWYGKAKTVLQIIAIVLFLVKDSLYLPTFASVLDNPLYLVSWLVMIAALVLTVISMLDYLSKARHLLGFAPADANTHDASGDAAEHPALEEKELEARKEAVRAAVDAKAAAVVARAVEHSMQIGTAESLTGGLIAAALTSVAGSSAVVRGGVVSYAYGVKEDVLHVSSTLLAEEGAVNEATARQMATGAAETLGADITVAVTGIAGPGGAEPGKPVGTVWLAVYRNGACEARELHLAGNRELVRLGTVEAALDAFLDALA